MKILIGIDTGVHTGFAVAFDHGEGGELQKVESLSITQAMQSVLEFEDEHDLKDIMLYIEDARKRTWGLLVVVKRRKALDRLNVMRKFGKIGVKSRALILS